LHEEKFTVPKAGKFFANLLHNFSLPSCVSISLTRIAGVIFEDNNIIDLEETPEVIEFYSATILEPLDDGKIAYNIQLFHDLHEHFLNG